MMNAENSEVLYKFRVTGTDGKPFIIFNGVSANSWLSPVGIRLNQEDKDQIKLPQRPKSSGSIMIIRHHPSPKGLNSDEVIQGVRLDKRSVEKKPEERQRPRSELARPSGGTVHRGGSRLTSAGRPHTAFGDKFLKRQPLQRKCESHEHPNLELTIQSLELKRTARSSAPETSGITDKSDFMTTNRLHSAFVPKNIYTSAMFAKRAKSAPPNVRSDGTKPAMSNRGPVLYWRAKSAYHRKMLATSSDMEWDITDSSSPSYKGSMLRPLMYCEDGELKHSAGCPYKCKGCFRACLVSKDYLEKMKKRKEAPPRKSIKQRPMVKKDARFVMHMALARNQPIYKIVHGDEDSQREAWTEKHSKSNIVSETENFINGDRDHLTSVVPIKDQSLRSEEHDIKDVAETIGHHEERITERDRLYLNRDNTPSNKQASVENARHTTQFKLSERNTIYTEYEHDPKVSSENILYYNRNSTDFNHTENGINPTHSQDTHKRLSRGISKHCSFDQSLPVEISPLSTENMDHQPDLLKSNSVSPVEKAIRTLYETECRTPESDLVKSEGSERVEVFSKKSEELSDISERSKALNEKSDVFKDKSEGYSENFDDSLTDESTISLGLPTDDDADTLGDSLSSEVEETCDSNRETSPSLTSISTQSECSVCSSQKHGSYKPGNVKELTNRRISRSNKNKNGAILADHQSSSEETEKTGTCNISHDRGVTSNHGRHRPDRARFNNSNVTSDNDENAESIGNNKGINTCVKQERSHSSNNVSEEADDNNVVSGGEAENVAIISDDVKRHQNQKVVNKKKAKQRRKKRDASKGKETKKNRKQTHLETNDKGDEDDIEQDSSDVNSNEEEDNNSDILDIGSADVDDDSDPEYNTDSCVDSDKEDNAGSVSECSKEESCESDGDVSQVENSEAETDHNNNDTDDNKNDNSDSNSDDSIENNDNDNTQDEACNEDDDNTEDDVNKDDSNSDDNADDKDNTDTEDHDKDDSDSEVNDNTENKDNSDTEDNVSNDGRYDSDAEHKNDSCTDEDASKDAEDNSDTEDNKTKEGDESDTENNDKDTDNSNKKHDESESHTEENDSDGDDGDVEEESGDSVSNDSGDDDDDDNDDGSEADSDGDDASESSDVKVVKSRRR